MKKFFRCLASLIALILMLLAVPLSADIAPIPDEVPSLAFLRVSTPPPPRVLEAADAFCLAFVCDSTIPVGIAPAGTHPAKSVVPVAVAKEMMGPPAPRRRVDAPAGFVSEHKPLAHFGAANLLVGLTVGVASGFDIRTTLQARNLAGTYEYIYPDGHTKIVTVSFYEKTGFYRASAMRGSAKGMIWQKSKINVPILVASQFMRRSKSKAVRFAGWALPAFAAGLQFKAGLDNKREINNINKLLVW